MTSSCIERNKILVVDDIVFFPVATDQKKGMLLEINVYCSQGNKKKISQSDVNI